MHVAAATAGFRWITLLLALFGLGFATSAADAAQIKLVQNGSATIAAGASSTTATITAVDMTKAVLIFDISVDGADPANAQVSGQLTNATTITFARVGTVGAVSVKWYVAEFAAGVTVQRGSTTLSATTTTVTLTSAVDLAHAFPVVSLRAGGTTYSGNDMLRAKLTATTTLDLTVGASPVASTVAEWQVIEIASAQVQTGDVSITAGSASATAAPAALVTGKTWLVYSYTGADGTATNIGEKLVRGRVTSATELTFDRDSAGEQVDLTWYAVEFTDGTTVQSGTQAFTTAETTKTATISAIDLGRSIALGGNYMRGGRSAHVTTDNPGVGWFTVDLTSTTTLQMTRALTGTATADLAWFVIEFTERYVQSGTATIADGSSSTTVAISAVDLTKALLTFDVALSSADPNDGQVSGQLDSPTSATFARMGTTGAVTIKWYVAEFGSGVTVQRGSHTSDATTSMSVTLGTAVDLSRSFPLVTVRSNGATYSGNDFVKAKLLDPSTLGRRSVAMERPSAAPMCPERGCSRCLTRISASPSRSTPRDASNPI